MEINKNYYLMNKNNKLLRFKIDELYGTNLCKEVESFSSARPLGFTDINEWMEKRSFAKHHKHLNEYLIKCGINDKRGLAELTHCLSLTDSLWVRSENENLSWEDVNLFTHDFTEVVSRLAFDGTGMYCEELSFISPELTTDGGYPKCWIKEDDDIFLLKRGYEGALNNGLEPYCEVLASQIFSVIVPNSVKYELVNFRGKKASKCATFTSDKYGFMPLSSVVKSINIEKILEIYKELDSEELFKEMIIADCVSLNSDRHLGNLGFLVDNDSLKPIKISPSFDFNLAMLPQAMLDSKDNDFLHLEDYLKVHPPVFGNNYVDIGRSFLSSETISRLINLKNTELRIECDDTFSEIRLKFMNEIKDIQIDKILGKGRLYQVSNNIF